MSDLILVADFREYILFMKESLRFYELHQYFNLVGSFAERYDIAI